MKKGAILHGIALLLFLHPLRGVESHPSRAGAGVASLENVPVTAHFVPEPHGGPGTFQRHFRAFKLCENRLARWRDARAGGILKA